MITVDLASGSARHAVSILRAWERRDIPLLRTALDRALCAPRPSSVSSAEDERNELLQGIASAIGARPDAERLGVCLSLLRHLVSTDS